MIKCSIKTCKRLSFRFFSLVSQVAILNGADSRLEKPNDMNLIEKILSTATKCWSLNKKYSFITLYLVDYWEVL